MRAKGGIGSFSAGIAQLARASAFQAEGRGFEPRFPLHYKIALQLVEWSSS